MYELAGLEEAAFSVNNAVVQVCDEEQEENDSEFDMQFETIDENSIYVEEQVEDPMSDDATAVAAPVEVLKIEKIEKKEPDNQNTIVMEEDESASFDFFEEIVGVESNDQKYDESGYMKDDL